MAARLSVETLEFIRTSFKSVWALELLLLMHRERSREWSIDDLSHELRANDLIVNGILPEFVKNGLVSESQRHSILRHRSR